MPPLKLFLGGTFDPVHIGHARLALECWFQLRPEQVSFLPCSVPPHKTQPCQLPHHRLAMLERVITDLNGVVVNSAPVFHVEQCEILRGGASYSVETLKQLRGQWPSVRLVWVIGMDSWVSIKTWRDWRRLTDYANLLVVNRPGFRPSLDEEQQIWLQERRVQPDQFEQSGGVAFLNTTPLEVASSSIRQVLSSGQSGKYLLPESVLDYIQEHALYTNHETERLL